MNKLVSRSMAGREPCCLLCTRSATDGRSQAVLLHLPGTAAGPRSQTPQSAAAVTLLPPAAVTRWPHLLAQLSLVHAKSYLAKLTA